MKNNFTEWEECIEGDKVVYRIIEIRYINKDIIKIPDSIGDLDSLRHLALENNQITTIFIYNPWRRPSGFCYCSYTSCAQTCSN